MRKIVGAVGVAVVALLALVAPSAAQAAPVAQPSFTGNDITLAVTHSSNGDLVATLPEPWNVGDCQQLQGGTLTLRSTGPTSSVVQWRAFLLTRHTSSRDIWFEDATYFTAAGSQVANTVNRMQGPDMMVGPIYPTPTSLVSVASATSLLPLVTSVHLHAVC
jgi:hypothetical protein